MTEPVDLAIDVREPADVIEAAQDHPAVGEVVLEELPAGDFVARDVAVERKTWSDYVSSLKSDGERSLYDQVRKLTDGYEAAYILVEGDMADTEGMRFQRGMNPRSTTGSMASITARHGVPVVPVSDLRHLIRYTAQLARKHTEDPSSPRLVKGAVGLEEPTVKRMYGCLPKIGPEMADRLYEAYPSLPDLIEADAEEVAEVDGIGPKRAESIQRRLS